MDHDRAAAPRGLAAGLAVLLLVALGGGLLLGRYVVPARAARGAAPPAASVPDTNVAGLMRDPQLKRAIVEHLAELSQGVWDSFPDPDVGRVMLVGKADGGLRDLQSNRFGMREREYETPKPPGLTRVVLLGDSFVYGHGVSADERLGVHLERELLARAAQPGAGIEVLHLGITGWNIKAECSWLRRQLSSLRPDLVVQVLFYNDLDDACTARGYGAMARFSSQNPLAMDSFTTSGHAFELGFSGLTATIAGLDSESRNRYEAAGRDLLRLRRALTVAGSSYLAVLHWPVHTRVAHDALVAGLEDRERALLPVSFFRDMGQRLSEADPHWNGAGHRTMARLLYGLIQQRALLPGLELPPWDEASRAVVELHEKALSELGQPQDPSWAGAVLPGAVEAAVACRPWTEAGARQVHAGVDKAGLVAPMASMLLRNEGARALRVRGSGLARPELDGAVVSVFLDEVRVGTIGLRAGAPISFEAAVPEGPVRERPFLTLRLACNDWVYTDADLRHAVSFRLDEAALVR